MENKDYSTLEKEIKYTFKNKKTLQEALTHSSFLNENKKEQNDNERLEFLGDAVLDAVVSRYLFDKYKDSMEGELSFSRSILVNTNSLAKQSEALELHKYMRFSHGQGKKISPSILAGVYEALLGAIYIDAGIQTVEKFIYDDLLINAETILAQEPIKDAKTRFQEEAQKHMSITPTYELDSEEGPDHSKAFKVKVLLEDEIICVGRGPSKKEAEKDAAEKALTKKGWI